MQEMYKSFIANSIKSNVAAPPKKIRLAKSAMVDSSSTDEDMSFKHYQKKLTNDDSDYSGGSKKL